MKRNLKVYEAPGSTVRNTPQIRLQGKWLKTAGFAIGESIIVTINSGQIIITKQKEKSDTKI